MKVSVDGSPDWSKYDIYLDGEKVKLAVEASEEDGYVVVLDVHPRTNQVKMFNGRVQTKYVHGRVQLREKASDNRKSRG